MRGIRASLFGCALLAVAGPASTAAAQGAQDPVTVRTFMLQRLSQQQAADLLAPYMSGGKGEGVFTAGTGVRGVTVRGTRKTLVRADSLLRANDRPARTVRLRFQLITASDSLLPQDPAIAEVDAALRGLFRFRGYRLMSEGVVLVSEGASYSLTFGLAQQNQERYAVGGTIQSVGSGAEDDAAELSVRLTRPGSPNDPIFLLTTELTAQYGKTVVLGSGDRLGANGTFVLAVTPERVSTPGR